MSRIQLPEDLIRVLGLAVLMLFVAGVLFAGHITLTISGAPKPGEMPVIANWFLSSVNGTLALNLGAFLGMKGVGQQLTGPVGWLQKAAAVVYAVAVLVTWLLWVGAGLSEDATKVATILPEIGRTGLGVVLACFGAALGVAFTTNVRIRDSAPLG